MTSAMRTPIALPHAHDRGAAVLERVGLALLVWAAHRRAAPPRPPRRSIDLDRVPRGIELGRPFC